MQYRNYNDRDVRSTSFIRSKCKEIFSNGDNHFTANHLNVYTHAVYTLRDAETQGRIIILHTYRTQSGTLPINNLIYILKQKRSEVSREH